MKKMLLMFVVLGSVCLMSGCWDRRELNDTAIITAAAIDKNPNDQIELSIQVIIPRALGGGGGGTGGGGGSPGSPVTLVRSGEGRNMADAMSKLQGKLPRKIFWGHCKVYLFGEELAREGITEEIDFLIRHPEPRNRSYLYVSKGRAKDVLEMKTSLESYSGEVLRELSNMHVGLGVTLVDLRKMLRGEGKGAALPMIGVLKTSSGEGPGLVGTAIFKKGKMIGVISESETRGMMWIRDEIKVSIVTVKTKQGEVSLSTLRAAAKLTPKIEKGVWKMLVDIQGEGDLIQNGTNVDYVDPVLVKDLEQATQEYIVSRIERALQKVQKEMKVDVLGFGAAFHRRYPEEWANMRDRWEEEFAEVDVSVTVRTSIRRFGLATIPGGVPKEEVETR